MRYNFFSSPDILADGGFDSHGKGPEEESSAQEVEEALDCIEPEFRDWNETRKDHELELWELKTGFDTKLKQKALRLEDKLRMAERWAEKGLTGNKTYEKNPERGSHSFEQYEDLGLASFVEALSGEADEAHRNYMARGNKVIDLKERLDEIDNRDMREALEEPQKTRFPFTNLIKKQVAWLTGGKTGREAESEWQNLLSERRADKKEEIREDIDRYIEESREDHREFLHYFDEVEETYSAYAADVSSYMDREVSELEAATSMLENLSQLHVPVLEDELEELPEDHEKMVKDREQKVRESYIETVNSLSDRALQQHGYVEDALTEMKEVEEGMSDQHFGDIKKSGELEEEVQELYQGESYQHYIEKLRDHSLNEERSETGPQDNLPVTEE